MAWTTPPTFEDEAVLSASDMNILSDDLEYLNGYVAGGNPAVASVVSLASEGGATPRSTHYFVIRHLHQYLHARILSDGDDDDVKISYGAKEVFEDGSPDGTEDYVIDLSEEGLTVGQLYIVTVALRGDNPRIIYYLIESDQNTL
jgi:hypothetical protein